MPSGWSASRCSGSRRGVRSRSRTRLVTPSAWTSSCCTAATRWAGPTGTRRRRRSLERALLQNLIRVGWGVTTQRSGEVFGTLFLPEGTPEQHQWFNDLAKTMPVESALRVRQTTDVIDVRREAAEVRAPALVLHARGDGMVPFEIGRQLAAHIPGARFVPLESRNHVLLETEPAWARFVEEVRAFLGSETPAIS